MPCREWLAALEDAVRRRGRPFLGICVGMQLMASRGLEHEIVAGLDWIPGDVDLIRPTDPQLKIPHMGWNTLDVRRDASACSADVRDGWAGIARLFRPFVSALPVERR